MGLLHSVDSLLQWVGFFILGIFCFHCYDDIEIDTTLCVYVSRLIYVPTFGLYVLSIIKSFYVIFFTGL